ncbi:MAG: hypothetical protein GF347_00080 [Candidatus Moranbacteria bacterium]|nr:hypothetical protein [Candidatus Moranbacteria bacterium]
MSNLSLFKDESIDPVFFSKINEKFIQNIKKYSLKYLENSSNYILLLDKIIDEVAKDMDEKKKQRLIAQAGSFLGESLKSSDFGEWIFSSKLKCWVIELPDKKKRRFEVNVFSIVQKRIENGIISSIGIWYRNLQREIFYGVGEIPSGRILKDKFKENPIAYYDNFFYNQGFYPISNTTLDIILDRYQKKNELKFLEEWENLEVGNKNLYQFIKKYLADKNLKDAKVVYFITIFMLIYKMLEYESEMYSYKLFSLPEVREKTINETAIKVNSEEEIKSIKDKIKIENPDLFKFFETLTEVVVSDDKAKENSWIIFFSLAFFYEIFDVEFKKAKIQKNI